MVSTISTKLNSLQDELDDAYIEYIKKEFEIKLAHHAKVSSMLDARDSLLKEELSREEMAAFYCQAFTNFDIVQDFLPLDTNGKYNTSFIKYFKAEYLDGGRLMVHVELYENDYVKNTVLEKTIFIGDKDPECVKLEWKNEAKPCIFFNFFEADEDSYDLFDLIYELYLNLIAYNSLDD